MKKKDYDKQWTTISAFLNERPELLLILSNCFFLPNEKDWKVWTNPWGTVFEFKNKNKNPKITVQDTDFSKLCLPVSEIGYLNTKKILKNLEKAIYFSVNENFYFIEFYSKCIRLFENNKIVNPLTVGIETLLYLLDNTQFPKKKKIKGSCFLGGTELTGFTLENIQKES